MTLLRTRSVLAVAVLVASSAAFANPYGMPAPYGYPGGDYARPPMSYPAPQARPPMPQMPMEQRHVEASPAQLLQNGIRELQTFMASDQARDRGAIEQFIRQRMDTYFDFNRMAELVGGPRLRDLDEGQKAAFRQRLQEMFLTAFVNNIASRSGQQPEVDFLPTRRVGDDEVNVYARVRFPDNSTSRLVFRLSKDGNSWKVFDVSADGSSAVLYYRKHFMAQARQYGPQGLVR